jgi:transposase
MCEYWCSVVRFCALAGIDSRLAGRGCPGDVNAQHAVAVRTEDAGYQSEASLSAPGPDRLIADGKTRDLARREPADGPPPDDATAVEANAHRLRTPRAARSASAALPAEVLKPLEHEFRHAVLAGLASVSRVPGPKNSTRQKPGRELLEFCKDRQDDVLRFTTDTRIWPTNNISERGVRPLKTQQKVSGRLASDDATQDRLDIRGYIDTARKHGKNARDVLHDLMLGRPWRPPAQALSP